MCGHYKGNVPIVNSELFIVGKDGFYVNHWHGTGYPDIHHQSHFSYSFSSPEINGDCKVLFALIGGITAQECSHWQLTGTAGLGTRVSLLGLYSLSGKTSYRKISWSLEAARFGFKLFQSLWNLAGTSAALLPRYLPNFRAIRALQHPISRLRHFTRFGGKTSYRLVNRGLGSECIVPVVVPRIESAQIEFISQCLV